MPVIAATFAVIIGWVYYRGLSLDEAFHGHDASAFLWTALFTMVGLDGYFFTPQATFNTVFGPTLSQVRTFTSRPIFIVETGANPSADRPAQISGLFKGAREAGIIGVIWFDYYKYPGHDWVIDNDPAALNAFRYAAEMYR